MDVTPSEPTVELVDSSEPKDEPIADAVSEAAAPEPETVPTTEHAEVIRLKLSSRIWRLLIIKAGLQS